MPPLSLTAPSNFDLALLLLLLALSTIIYLILGLHQWRLRNTIHSPRQITLVTFLILMCVFIAFAVLFLEPLAGPVMDDASVGWLRFFTFRTRDFWRQGWERSEEYAMLGWECGLDFVDLGKKGTVRVIVVL